MSKVRINDLARELEVKPRAILDILPELGVAGGKTHSSSLEADEAEKVRAHFDQEAQSCRACLRRRVFGRQPQGIVPKIDLSHISKPGDVMKAVLAKKHEEEEEARHPHVPAKPAAAAACQAGGDRASCTGRAPAAPAAARPAAPPHGRNRAELFRNRAPRRPSLRLRLHHPPLLRGRRRALSSPRPPPARCATRPVVVVAPPPGGVVVKPPAAPTAA